MEKKRRRLNTNGRLLVFFCDVFIASSKWLRFHDHDIKINQSFYKLEWITDCNNTWIVCGEWFLRTRERKKVTERGVERKARFCYYESNGTWMKHDMFADRFLERRFREECVTAIEEGRRMTKKQKQISNHLPTCRMVSNILYCNIWQRTRRERQHWEQLDGVNLEKTTEETEKCQRRRKPKLNWKISIFHHSTESAICFYCYCCVYAESSENSEIPPLVCWSYATAAIATKVCKYNMAFDWFNCMTICFICEHVKHLHIVLFVPLICVSLMCSTNILSHRCFRGRNAMHKIAPALRLLSYWE